MKNEANEHYGKFVQNLESGPLRKIDCAKWQAAESTNEWTTGRLRKNFVTHPLATVDCSTWEASPSMWLRRAAAPVKLIAGSVMQPERKAEKLCDVCKWSLEFYRAELLLIDVECNSLESPTENNDGRRFVYMELPENLLQTCRSEINSLVENVRDSDRLAEKVLQYIEQSASKLRAAMLVQKPAENGDDNESKTDGPR